jgi:hypothetical protein
MTRIAVPALIVLLTVVALLAAAGWNRSGEPALVITLSERELRLPPTRSRTDEDPALTLRLVYDAPQEPLESRNWLPETRLRQLGFTMNVPAGAPQAAHTYDRVPPRVAWVAFEYDGPRWRERERRRALREPGRLREPAVQSRLVPVDAALDFETLQTRYPSGHLILRAVIGLSYLPPAAGGPLLWGRLVDVVPSEVAVPSELRTLLTDLKPRVESELIEPRYEAELAIGELGLPYLRAVRLRE